MNLYLVALLPAEPIRSQVWALKQEMHQRTGSRNALRLPPHVTLVPPVRQPPDFEAQAAAALQAFGAGQVACPLHLRGFAWFQQRTLYVRITDDADLQAQHAALYRYCARHLPAVPPARQPFVPHLTLATRDLPPAQVPALQAEFATRTYHADGLLPELVLYRHNGQQWEARTTVRLPPPAG